MAFSDDINAFAAKVKRRQQPVDISTLKNSWQITFPDPNTAQTATNIIYAKPIEDGVGVYGPLTLRSKTGGFHSVKLTRAAWPKIVTHISWLNRGLA